MAPLITLRRARTLVAWALLSCAACASTVNPSFVEPVDAPDDEPTVVDGTAVLDATAPIDAPAPRDAPAPLDAPAPFDAPPVDQPAPGDTSPPDAPDVVVGMCPSSCASNAQCLPCRTPTDPGEYCCISGLCLYTTGMCAALPTDGGLAPDAFTEGPLDAMPPSTPDAMTPSADVGGVD